MTANQPESAPRRGRPSVTTLEAIQSAALRVLDREGLAGLTVRGVARELGIGGPRLYTHIQDHEQLVTLAYEAAEAELADLDWAQVTSTTGWQDGLRMYAHVLERHLTAHRGLVELSLRRRFFPTSGLAPVVLESIVSDAVAHGVDLDALADAFLDITTVVVSVAAARATSDGTRNDQIAHDIERIAPQYPAAGSLLRRISTRPRSTTTAVVEDILQRLSSATKPQRLRPARRS